MATRKKTGKDEQYLPIPYAMARSEAWRSLRGSSIKIYVELRSRYHGGNNGKLTLSMDEAARLLGVSKSTVQSGIAELIDKGFVKMTKRGHWYGRKATEYAVTDRRLDGRPATYDWRQWTRPKKQSLGTDTERIWPTTVR